jgi:hypothetical protein
VDAGQLCVPPVVLSRVRLPLLRFQSQVHELHVDRVAQISAFESEKRRQQADIIARAKARRSATAASSLQASE